MLKNSIEAIQFMLGKSNSNSTPPSSSLLSGFSQGKRPKWTNCELACHPWSPIRWSKSTVGDLRKKCCRGIERDDLRLGMKSDKGRVKRNHRHGRRTNPLYIISNNVRGRDVWSMWICRKHQAIFYYLHATMIPPLITKTCFVYGLC